jgi:hypothetical protein
MSGVRLRADIANLDQFTASELIATWERHLTQRVPDHLPKALLARLLSYQLQAQLHGGLSKRSAAYLKAIEADLIAGRKVETPSIEQKQMKPGTQIVREHEGILHRVMVLEGGFAWDGRTYASLSAVAKAITKTNWNGHRFFGLREKKKDVEGASS